MGSAARAGCEPGIAGEDRLDIYIRAVKSLARHFMDSGTSFLRRALEAYPDDDSPFLLNGTAAVEMFLKAYLSDINPLLVLDGRDHAAMMWFAREDLHKQFPLLASAKTISCETAINMAISAGLEISNYRPGLHELRRARNAVAHMGVLERRMPTGVLVDVLRTSGTIASALGVKTAAIYGDHEDYVKRLIDEQLSADERELQARIANAKIFVASRYPGLVDDLYAKSSQELRKSLDASARLNWRRNGPEDQIVSCPVCDVVAYETGDLDLVGWEYPDDDKADDNDEYAVPIPRVLFTAYTFRCPTCELQLYSPDQIELSGARFSWELDQDDAEAFVEGWSVGYADASAEDAHR